MKKSAFGIGLLLFVMSCSVGRQPLSTGNHRERGLSFSEDKDTLAALIRREEIPLLQLDASSVYREMLSYVTPQTETPVLAPQEVTEKLTAYISYPPDGISVDPKYGNNRAELEKMKQKLAQWQAIGNRLQSIHLTGYASPDGDTGTNERLAGNRSIRFKEYLQKELRLPDKNLITIDWVGEDWDGLQALIATSGRAYSPRVQAILGKVSDASERRKQIRALDKGAVYKDLEKSFFVRLRRMELAVTLRLAVPQPVTPLVNLPAFAEKLNTEPAGLTLSELLQLSTLYRPGTEQYREVYELAAYRFPDCRVAQLNAGAASLALGDREAAAYFLQQASDDPRSWNNLGVLSLMQGDATEALSWFRKSMPQNPRLARHNIRIAQGY